MTRSLGSAWQQEHDKDKRTVPLCIEVMAHRKLHRPSTDEDLELWLIRFTYEFKDDLMPKTGHGVVGSMTWSSFEEYKKPPSSQELFRYHGAREMEHDKHRGEKVANERRGVPGRSQSASKGQSRCI